MDATTKITKKVPAALKGEAESPAVKTDKCTVNHVVTELEITCLGAATARVHRGGPVWPDQGSLLHVNDIKLPVGIKVVTHGKPNPVIVTPVEPVAEEIVVAAAPAADDKKKGKGKK